MAAQRRMIDELEFNSRLDEMKTEETVKFTAKEVFSMARTIEKLSNTQDEIRDQLQQLRKEHDEAKCLYQAAVDNGDVEIPTTDKPKIKKRTKLMYASYGVGGTIGAGGLAYFIIDKIITKVFGS